MPEIFTIFNHGTDFHRDKNPNELVTQLSDSGNIRGFEARVIQDGIATKDNPTPWKLDRPLGVDKYTHPSYLICEGPGSAEVSEEESSSGVQHAHPGKYNPFTGGDKGSVKKQNPLIERPSIFSKDRAKKKEFQDHFMGNTDKPFQMSGRISGSGWDDNVYKALFILSGFLDLGEDALPKTINMVGWSRGAVTCLKMAYKLQEVFPQIDVNIFAVDPVPGQNVMDHEEDTRTITPNVANYVGILSLHDDRQNFEPICFNYLEIQPRKQDSSKRNILFLPFPGNHSDVVIDKKDAEQQHSSVAASSNICTHLAWRFLSHFGTRFQSHFDEQQSSLNNQKICHLYEHMLQNLDIISRIAKSSGVVDRGIVGGGFLLRSVCEYKFFYSPPPFLNLHHLHCHMRTYSGFPAPRLNDLHKDQGDLTTLVALGLGG